MGRDVPERARTPCVAPEMLSAPSVASPAPREPGATVAQQGAIGCELTLARGEFGRRTIWRGRRFDFGI